MSGKTLKRPREVCKKLGISRTELWSRTKNGDFPQPVKLGPKSIAYVDEELDAYIEKLIATRDQGRAA